MLPSCDWQTAHNWATVVTVRQTAATTEITFGCNRSYKCCVLLFYAIHQSSMPEGLSELFCVVLCTEAVHSRKHT